MSNTVPAGWEIFTLDQVFSEIKNGCSVDQNGIAEGFPVTRIETISHEEIDYSKTGYIQTTENIDRFIIDKGDILFSHINSLKHIGKTAIKRDERLLYHGMNLLRLKVRKLQFSPTYIHNLLSWEEVREDMRKKAKQAINQASLNVQDIKSSEYAIPPLPEQQKIATILSSVDDVIEKTRAQIDKLKDLKTGMMQELLTKGIGHTEFKDSPVGRIPAAWGCKTLDQLAAFVTSGSRGWAQYYSDAGPIFIRIGNLTREHINLRFNDTVHVSPPDSAEGKRTQVQLGDVLISITADLGVIGVVNESIGEAYVNQHISLVRLRDSSEARWVGHFLAFENTQKQFTANNDSGAKAGLNLPAIRNTLVAMPAKNERDKIVETLDSIDTDIVMKRTMLERISSVKKALMQDLLTGKVRVKLTDKESAVV